MKDNIKYYVQITDRKIVNNMQQGVVVFGSSHEEVKLKVDVEIARMRLDGFQKENNKEVAYK